MKDGVQARIRLGEQTAERFTGKPGPGGHDQRVLKRMTAASNKRGDSPAYPYLNSVPIQKEDWQRVKPAHHWAP